MKEQYKNDESEENSSFEKSESEESNNSDAPSPGINIQLKEEI